MSGNARIKATMRGITVVAVAGSIFLTPLAYAKHASFDMPACEKLMEGSTPDSSKQNAPTGGTNNKDLTPLKLTNDQDSYSLGADGKVKMEVQQNVTVQPGAPGDSSDPGAKKSIIGNDDKLKKKLLKDSQTVNVAPMALQETDGEAQQKADTISDSERAQLTDLWTATINRSPDIQFVINRLQPNTDGGHVTAKAIQLIGGALFTAVSAAPLMMPGGASPAMFMGTSSGVSLLQSLLNEHTGKSLKKQQISQEQATMLYSIVRQTAEKVVVEYRKYRHNRNDFERANRDLEDLKSMVASAHRSTDPSKQIEMEYTIRKAQRDVDKIVDEAKLHRQQLIDLSGSDAVSRLDGQMEQEMIALQRLVPGGDAVTQEIKPNPLQTATKEKETKAPL